MIQSLWPGAQEAGIASGAQSFEDGENILYLDFTGVHIC